MTQKKNTTDLTELLLKCMAQPDPMCRTTIHIGQLRKNKIQKWTHRLQ
jgi:hypothetical protein